MKPLSAVGRILFQHFIPILISLLLCELILYICNYPAWMREDAWNGISTTTENDPTVGWRHTEGEHHYVREGRIITQHYLADGSRFSGPYDPTSELKIIGLFGDSFVEGYGLDDSETIASLINKQQTSYYTKNFGVGGYGPLHSFLQLKELLSKNSNFDQIVYFFNTFDETRNSGMPDNPLILPWKKDYSQIKLPVARVIDNSIRISYELPFLPTTFAQYSRLLSLVSSAYRQLVYTLQFNDHFKISLQLMNLMQNECANKRIKFKVILLDGETNKLIEYSTSLNALNIDTYILSINNFIDEQYRFMDGHPRGLLNELIAKQFILDIERNN